MPKRSHICGGTCHLDGLLSVLTVHAGIYRHDVAALFCANFGYALSLCSSEAGNFSRVPVADKSLYAFVVEGLDPAEIHSELFSVYAEVIIERY